MAVETVNNIRRVLQSSGDSVKPIFGICLGHQGHSNHKTSLTVVLCRKLINMTYFALLFQSLKFGEYCD